MKVFDISNGELNGVFKYYNTFSNFDNNATAKASSLMDGRKVINAIKENNDVSFITDEYNSQTPQWASFELKKAILSITSYTIRSPVHDYNDWPHLRNWNLLGSIDGHKWDILDIQENSTELNGYITHNFNCSYNYGKLHRFFKIQQTGIGFTGRYGFGINRFELFGTLYEVGYVPKYRVSACKRNSFIINSLLVIYLIILS